MLINNNKIIFYINTYMYIYIYIYMHTHIYILGLLTFTTGCFPWNFFVKTASNICYKLPYISFKVCALQAVHNNIPLEHHLVSKPGIDRF